MKKVIVAPEFPRYPGDWHFSPALEAGGFVFFSGITGVHPDQSIESDPPTQFRDVFRFVGIHLRAAALGFEHIVDMTTYHVDLRKHRERDGANAPVSGCGLRRAALLRIHVGRRDAFRVLPAHQRRAMCALYAFLRISDDLSDADGPVVEKRERLTSWRETLDRSLAGEPVHEISPALVDLIREVATRKAATPAQIALGWLLAQKPWIVPIPGTTKLHRLEENLGGADVEFSTDELTDITAAGSRLQLVGDRLPKEMLGLTGQ